VPFRAFQQPQLFLGSISVKDNSEEPVGAENSTSDVLPVTGPFQPGAGNRVPVWAVRVNLPSPVGT